MKWLGAGYLVYVGLRLLTSKAGSAIKLEAVHANSAGGTAPFDAKTIFLRGFWTNVLNPKVALFFLAFVPQFIAPTVEYKASAFLLLGMLFNLNGLWVNLGWALAAAWLADRAPLVQKSMRWLDRIAGAMFIGFGIKLAFTEAPHA
mgnify:CR=1 FL=1